MKGFYIYKIPGFTIFDIPPIVIKTRNMSLKKNFILVMFPFLSLLSAGHERLVTDNGNLHSGYSAIDITPLKPVKLYGYSSKTVYSEGVHDPLTASAVFFENNGKKVVLVSCDLGSFENDVFSIVQKSIIEKFGLDESVIFLAPENVK
jgi:hypothetical protein